MYGKLTTTKPRAKALRGYALSKVNAFGKLSNSLESKRWLKVEVSTTQYMKRVTDKLKSFDKTFAVSMVMVQPRKGDNAQQYEVSILNFEPKKSNE